MAAFFRTLWRRPRVRIAVFAVLAGIFTGATMIALPIEDYLLGARTTLVRKPVPQDIVVIEIDERSVQAFDVQDVPRSTDAKVVAALLDAGGKRVFFDRSFHFPKDSAGDAAFAEMLRRYPGQVFLGALADENDPLDAVSMLPAPAFREHVGITALMAFQHPFGLSFSFPVAVRAGDTVIPGLAAGIAGVEGQPGEV